jgi:hypothetical protein
MHGRDIVILPHDLAGLTTMHELWANAPGTLLDRLEVAIERREPKSERLHEDRDVIEPDRQLTLRSQPDVGFREVVPDEQ